MVGKQYMCQPEVERSKQMLTGKDIREHYVEKHDFEQLKLWGLNKELLKQELGYPESTYQEEFVQKFDVNDTFRGIEYNEKEYAKQEG